MQADAPGAAGRSTSASRPTARTRASSRPAERGARGAGHLQTFQRVKPPAGDHVAQHRDRLTPSRREPARRGHVQNTRRQRVVNKLRALLRGPELAGAMIRR
jgi:hypothetical protein